MNFVFKFNEEIIAYESENAKREIKWNLIQKYHENDKEIYLFLEGNQLFDIMSELIMGVGKYAIFKKILKNKIDRFFLT